MGADGRETSPADSSFGRRVSRLEGVSECPSGSVCPGSGSGSVGHSFQGSDSAFAAGDGSNRSSCNSSTKELAESKADAVCAADRQPLNFLIVVMILDTSFPLASSPNNAAGCLKDDSAMNRKMMSRILNADRDYPWLSGAFIAEADDGGAALDAIRQERAGGREFDFVLMDYHMVPPSLR